MDTTKDIVDEEMNNNVDGVSSLDDQPDSNNTNTDITSTSSVGLQQIEDDTNGLPLPMGMAEEISNLAEPPKQIGKVEQIDDDDLGPEPPTAMLEASLNAADPEINNKISKTISNNLSSINELNPPMPFSSNFEQDAIAKKIAKDEMMNQKLPAVSTDTNNEEVPPSDRDSIYEPPREVIEDTNRRGWEDIDSGSNNNTRDIESQIRTDNDDAVGSINNNSMVDTEANVEVVPTSANQEAGDTEIHIPEAFLVEDGDDEVYDATPLEPTLPWWKQKRTRILVGVVSILLGTMAIALGVLLSKSNNVGSESTNSTMTVFVTPPPTPPRTYECFHEDDGGRDGILYNAVRAYIREDCANNQKCFIAQTYGWPMNSWCVDNVIDMSWLFSYMDTFNEDISGWVTSSVTDMSNMFEYASSFNHDVSNFNTSSVTNMNLMFYNAKAFNGDVSNFDTSGVTDMGYMFAYASSFNQDLSNFNTSSVADMDRMFEEATSFNGDVSNFDTASVTRMDSMFEGATSFNGDLSNFDTSSVTSMWYMFRDASSFNQDLSNFDTSSVTKMDGMFAGASLFNQDLCSWQDSFPYTKADNIFTESNCTYQDKPREDQKGPFCASDCQSSRPSMSPTSSLAPTTSQPPSQSPTISSSPTVTCYWIDIAVVFDDYPEETSWDIQKIDDLGDDKIVLKTVNGTSDSDDNKEAKKESMCLEGEREYQFTIYDEYGDGIEAPGYYNVTSDGKLIVKGGEFEDSESTIFSVP